MTPPARRSPLRSTAVAGLAIVGGLLLLNAAWLAFVANLTLGTGLVAVAGLALLAWARWFEAIDRRWWARTGVLTGAAAVFGVAGFLAVSGAGDDVDYREDAVIVPGAAVHGSELSNTLRARLDVALDYHRRNPRALVVVSGGQGFQENLPEGLAMQRYLLEQGVPAASIVLEDRATSTEENFALAKALLDARLPSGYRVAFVTDQFHVYRCGRIAAAQGLPATHLASVTPWYFVPSNYLRETALVLRSWLGG